MIRLEKKQENKSSYDFYWNDSDIESFNIHDEKYIGYAQIDENLMYEFIFDEFIFDEKEQDSISNDLLDLIWLKLDELNESIK
jgi:8-oxo-dGTP pyrophosphatase MutT (NUDIX family)